MRNVQFFPARTPEEQYRLDARYRSTQSVLVPPTVSDSSRSLTASEIDAVRQRLGIRVTPVAQEEASDGS